MTIPAGQSGVTYHTGNGTASTFDYEFKITAEADLKVTQTDTAGVDTVLVLNTDYTVTGVGNNAGGSITLVAGALASNYTLAIEDDVEVSQLTPFGNQSAFYANLHEDSYDKNTRIARKAIYEVDRSIKIPGSVQGVDTELPKPEALNLFRWNEDGTALENVETADLITTAQFSNFKTDTFVDGIDFTAGTTTTVTLDSAPGTKANTQVYFDGVYQEKSEYSLAATVITFNTPIPIGVGAVEVVYGKAADVLAPSTREVKIADGVATAYTLSNSYEPGNGTLHVYINGVRQEVGYGYAETNDSTVTFDSAPANGDRLLFLVNPYAPQTTADANNVTYTHPASGAVATNVGARLSQTVSVKDFGAVGDGVTDDTAAIQAAIDAVESVGSGRVFFPRGEYLVSSTITLSNTGVELFGDGPGNMVNTTPGTDAPTIIKGTSPTGAVIRIKNNSCRIRDLCISSDATRSSASYVVTAPGIHVEPLDTSATDTCDRTYISNIRVENQPGDGMLFSGPITMSEIEHCDVWSCKGMGYRFDCGQVTARTYTSYIGLIKFMHNRATFAGGNALAVSDPTADQQAEMGVRFHIYNFENYGCADDAAVRYSNHSTWLFLENSLIEGCAFSGQSAAGTKEIHGGLYIGGRNCAVRNSRFIYTSIPITVDEVDVAQPTRDIIIDQIRVVQEPTTTLAEIVNVDANASGIVVNVGEIDPAKNDFSRLITDTTGVRYNYDGRLTERSFNSGRAITIADDNYATINLFNLAKQGNVDGVTSGLTQASGVLTINGTAPNVGGGMFNFRVGSSQAITGWTSDSNTESGVVTGAINVTTDVTDTKLGIYVSDNGALYIANRRGFSITISMHFSCMSDQMLPLV